MIPAMTRRTPISAACAVPVAARTAEKVRGTPTALTYPISIGPLRFKKRARGAHLVLERNTGDWGTGRPCLDRMVFPFSADGVTGSNFASMDFAPAP